MSEVQTRPSGLRGRGGYRGGRGGYRGARVGSKTHTKSDDQENFLPSEPEEQGEVGELKKKYGDRVSTLRELCDGWSDEDLVYALKETDGDANLAFERISTGAISQWGEVGKKKPKTKDSTASDAASGTRGGRGRSAAESRGRGRGAERSRGTRGARGSAHSNGVKSTTKAADDGWGDSAATPAATSWDAPTNGATETHAAGEWSNEASTENVTPAPSGNKAEAAALNKSKIGGWAGLFAKPPPAPKKAASQIQVAKPEDATPTPAMGEPISINGLPPPVEEQLVSDGPSELPDAIADETPIVLTPSKDELTESNLEQLPDVSQPPTSATAASTVASTVDPSSTANHTSLTIRPGMSGYAASALKATSGTGRSASFQRRVMEQQEAVVMPGNHAVDRAAVQFGSMGLNGDTEDLDVDEEREEPETRTQLPDDSPAAPRASLPPLPAQAQAPASSQDYPDSQQTQRQAPGLPPVAAQHQQPSPSNMSSGYGGDQFSRYGQGATKAYDPFGQQPPLQQPSASQAQEPFSGQLPTSSQQPSSSAPNDYSQYYGGSREAQAQAYQQYYGAGYGQTQETQQRSGSAFGSSSQDVQSTYATSRPQQPSYGQHDVQNSGHNTPNPAMQGHQAQHSGHMQQGQGGYGQYGYGYPNAAFNQQYPQYGGQYGGNYMGQMGGRYGSNRPAYDDVRRQAGAADAGAEQHQTNAYNYGYNKQQYGGGNYGQSSMYGQPSQQYSGYEHSASPANVGGYGQSSMQNREAIYGRSGSTQPNEGQQTASGNAFGGPTSDPFGRSHSGFQGQGNQSDDPAKPSPSIAANRPGSAANSGIPGQQQQGSQANSFPPPQSQQGGNQAFGGYPQYNNPGAHHQAQGNHPQTTGYGGYGSNAAFSQYGGGYGSGRGWNGNQYGGSAH